MISKLYSDILRVYERSSNEKKQNPSAGNISPRTGSRSIDAVVAGYRCVDIAPEFSHGRASIPASELFRPGRLIETRHLDVSLDMALPDSESPAGKADWQGILENILPHVDIFVPSIEEILFMLDRPQYARILSGAAGRDMVDAVPRRPHSFNGREGSDDKNGPLRRVYKDRRC